MQTNTQSSEKFSGIRKGLLEFILLKMIDARALYVADILKEINQTDFARRKAPSIPSSAACGATDFLTMNGRNRKPALPESTTASPRKAELSSMKLRNTGRKLTR